MRSSSTQQWAIKGIAMVLASLGRGVVWAVLLCCTFLQAQLTPDRVKIEPAPSDGSHAIRYTLKDDNLHAFLEVRRGSDAHTTTDLYFGVTQDNEPIRCPSRLPIERRLEFLHPLFQYFLSTEKAEQNYSLFVYCYDEVDNRLPNLAATSREWQLLLKSRATQSALYKEIGKLLNEGKAYPELSEALLPFHYRVEIPQGGLENLWTRHVSELSPQQLKLISASVKESDILPIRVSKYYLLTKEP